MEMAFEHGGNDGDSGPSWFPSLFACAPDLHERTVLIRSATKGFSASGERYGVAVVGSARLRELMVSYIHESSIHAPRSGQFAYSRAMEQFDAAAAAKLQLHYRGQVDRARTALRESNLLWASPTYRVQGGFYLIIDLGRLRGRKLHARANAVFVASSSAAAAAGDAGAATVASPTIDTDVHAVFHLMFAHGLALAPMSLYGVDPHRLLLRVTCSCATAEEEAALLARLARVAAECNASA